MNRRLLGACFVVLVMLAGMAQTVPASQPLGNNIEPAVTWALAAGENPVEVIVTGPEHIGIDADHYVSRTSAMSALASKAAPFFDSMRRLAADTGSVIRETWAAGPSLRMVATPAAIERLSRAKNVRKVEHESPDAIHLIEPLPGADVGVMNTGGRQMIQAEDIWQLGFRGEGIKLAVIDTGIWGGHEAFKFADGSSRIVAWHDFTTHNYATPLDGNGHGTHVAGTSAGSRMYNDPTHGFFQEEGVAPRATLIGVKTLSDGGSGQWSWALSSLQFAFDNGADITSNSWGGGCSTDAIAVTALARTLTDLGMLSVFAAGNSGPGAGSVICPGRGESVLTIGAVDQNRVIAGFSSRGPCSDPDTGTPNRICPDVVAKGVNVRSSWPRPLNPSGYNSISGTSMATPHAAGAAVLAEQMKRDLTGSGWDTAARAEEEVFKMTALDLGTTGPDNSYGYGLIQLLDLYALLANQDIADIVDTFEITLPVIRTGNATTLHFGVRNRGGAVATGPFRATLTDPLGAVTTLYSSTPSLGFLDGESFTTAFTVTDATLPGVYSFRGTFDYTWTDPNGDPHSGSVDRSGSFMVKRVDMDAVLDGFEATASPVLPQDVSYTVTNNGNEAAHDVVVQVTVPVDYEFIPGENFDLSDLTTRYSNPKPDSVTENPGYGYITLSYNVGTLEPDDSFTFTSTVAARFVGTFTIGSKVLFKDEVNRSFFQTASASQDVVLPA